MKRFALLLLVLFFCAGWGPVFISGGVVDSGPPPETAYTLYDNFDVDITDWVDQYDGTTTRLSHVGGDAIDLATRGSLFYDGSSHGAHPTNVASAGIWAATKTDDGGGTCGHGIGMVVEDNPTIGATETWYAFLPESSNDTLRVYEGGVNAAGHTKEQIHVETADNINCQTNGQYVGMMVGGSGTSVEFAFWEKDASFTTMDDPSTWGAPDYCINQDGGDGGTLDAFCNGLYKSCNQTIQSNDCLTTLPGGSEPTAAIAYPSHGDWVAVPFSPKTSDNRRWTEFWSGNIDDI